MRTAKSWADIVVYNGSIRTASGEKSRATAIAIQNGRIVFIGEDSAALELLAARTDTSAIDLRGACLLPGLTDAHIHFFEFALGMDHVKADAPSLEALLERVADKARNSLENSWIVGFGWNNNVWHRDFPCAADLDRAAPGHPVCLYDNSGHVAWVNSAALRLARIGAETPDPPDGRIVRDSSGRPTGIFLEGAAALVQTLIPPPTEDQAITAMKKAMLAAHKAGITCVHDMDGPAAFSAWQKLRARGEQTLRVVKSIPQSHLSEAIALGLRSGLGDDMLRIGQVKMFADGAMGPRTAWLLKDYEDAASCGFPVIPIEEMQAQICRANAAGLACAVHAIGDRANREILNAFEASRAALGPAAIAALAAPNRVEHAQILHPDEFARFARLGVIASMQPIHATIEYDYAGPHLGSRCDGVYAFASLKKENTVLAFGSDCPVATMEPLAGLHAAVTRRRADGQPGAEGWHAEQRLSIAEAVAAYSMGPALAAGMASCLGSLALGNYADFTILDKDIFAIDPMEILDASVLATMVAGSFVWRADSI